MDLEKAQMVVFLGTLDKTVGDVRMRGSASQRFTGQEQDDGRGAGVGHVADVLGMVAS